MTEEKTIHGYEIMLYIKGRDIPKRIVVQADEMERQWLPFIRIFSGQETDEKYFDRWMQQGGSVITIEGAINGQMVFDPRKIDFLEIFEIDDNYLQLMRKREKEL